MKNRERILVVDDDADFLNVISLIMEKRGYRVDTASSAEEGISRIKARFYNAAILDISLPDADGTELLSSFLGIQPDIIAIMLTGHSSLHNAVQSLNCGAFAYLEKPLDPETLLSVISRGLEKQRLVLENRALLEELEQRNRITDTLLNVSRAVSQSLDLQQIIDASLEKVARHTGFEVGFIYLQENEGLALKGCRGLPVEPTARMEQAAGKSSGVIRRIFKTGKPITVASLKDTQDTGLKALNEQGYRSFIGMPLAILNENIGVMAVATASAGTDTSEGTVELLSSIGREIAIAVRNAQLYEAASSTRALIELDKLRTEFLANISHELRTPLAVIKGSANSLLQPDVIFDEATRQYFLQSIDKDADTLARLVDDLLMMSRLEAKSLEVRKKPHHFEDVIEAVRDRLDSITVRHRLKLDIAAGMPLVNLDDTRVGQVLTNLVENATKFSDDNTPILVTAAANGKEITVSVEDKGGGIPPEQHDKIFERFFQGNGRKSGRRKGTGLGLAICRGIVEAHGGRIRVESEPGQGASFTFTLPL
jgi:K+-sensing histidine kinase KdpD